MKSSFLISAILSSVIATATSANADSLFNFSAGNPTDAMASASRPDVSGSFEIESADDFVLTGGQTSINSASFTGLVVPGTGGTPSVSQVTVEIYRVFPLNSTLPPSGHVPTRNNSPSDVAFELARLCSRKPELYYGGLGSHIYSFEFCSSGRHPPSARPNYRRQRIHHRARGAIQRNLQYAFQPSSGSLFLRSASLANRRRSVLLALCSAPYRFAGHAIPRRIYRFAKLDARRKS